MNDRVYLSVTLVTQDAQAVRSALAAFVVADEYDLKPTEAGRLDIEIWACPLIFQEPLLVTIQALAQKLAPDQLTVVYIEDDQGRTEQYLGPRHLVGTHLQQEHQARVTSLNDAYQRALAHITAATGAFVCTQGW